MTGTGRQHAISGGQSSEKQGAKYKKTGIDKQEPHEGEGGRDVYARRYPEVVDTKQSNVGEEGRPKRKRREEGAYSETTTLQHYELHNELHNELAPS